MSVAATPRLAGWLPGLLGADGRTGRDPPPPPKLVETFTRLSFRLRPRLLFSLSLLTGTVVFLKLPVGLRGFYSRWRLRCVRGVLTAAGLLTVAVLRALQLHLKFRLPFDLDDPDLARAGVQHLLYRVRLFPGHREFPLGFHRRPVQGVLAPEDLVRGPPLLRPLRPP